MTYKVVISTEWVVEADDKEEARELACLLADKYKDWNIGVEEYTEGILEPYTYEDLLPFIRRKE